MFLRLVVQLYEDDLRCAFRCVRTSFFTQVCGLTWIRNWAFCNPLQDEFVLEGFCLRHVMLDARKSEPWLVTLGKSQVYGCFTVLKELVTRGKSTGNKK